MELVKTLRIDNELGLHGRAAAKIMQLAKQYKSQLFFAKDEKEVDGSSILSILTLACPKGTVVRARIVGEDSKELLEKLSELFEHRFGETK